MNESEKMTALYWKLHKAREKGEVEITSTDSFQIANVMSSVFLGHASFEESANELIRAIKQRDGKALAAFLKEQVDALKEVEMT